jgi:hypothetical protein
MSRAHVTAAGGQFCTFQGSYDDVLERLTGQSTALLQALGNGGGMAGAADENALAQVCLNLGL